MLKNFNAKNALKFLRRYGIYKRHTSQCYERTKYIFPGGFHKTQPTIFDKLESVGINVPQSEKYFPNFIVWDMEAMLQKIQSTSDSQDKKLQWLTKHVPISISIA